MPLRIESPADESALAEFVLFHDRVYEYRAARWPAMIAVQLPTLLGDGPFAIGRRFRPFAAWQNGAMVARAVALIDHNYQRHWNEPLGHLVMFEAMPNSGEAVVAIVREAGEWLKGQGVTAVRAGYGLLEFPFVIDEYENLPPDTARQNPDYYHSMLKQAGFESERGWVDYKIRVTPEIVANYENALERGRRAGFEIAALADLPAAVRVADFQATWNAAFARHWGVAPFQREELEFMFEFFRVSGGLQTSLLAYRNGLPVGALMATPPNSVSAILKRGRKLADYERLNFLGIGVLEAARGTGVNLAMAAHAYLRMIRMGSKYLSYTLVLDDNWPSRRTAEQLGAKVCANYVTYRMNF